VNDGIREPGAYGARSIGESIRRELYFFNLYRTLQACIYAGLAFSPLAVEWVTLRHPLLARANALVYLVYALAAFVHTRRWPDDLRTHVAVALAFDIVAATLAIASLADSQSGIAILLMVNVGAGALLLPPRMAGLFAAFAALALLVQTLVLRHYEPATPRSLVEPLLFGLAYFASAALCYVLGKQMRETEALAERRGIDLANLGLVNELIIHRLKTGVLLVDRDDRIRRMNESAWLLLGSPPPTTRDLGAVGPELARRLYEWRSSGHTDNTAVALAPEAPEVVPRFTRLAPHDDSNVLIFLDDTSLVSRRAEELTLSSLGRLAASIAHEIRNPLAAISYSAQLLAESVELAHADKRMVEIINNHCARANDVVENILQLSRRERSRPEVVDLNAWVRNFIEDYRASHDLGRDELHVETSAQHAHGLIDPQQLQQVMWNLLQNALRYGRLPDRPAEIGVAVRLLGEKGPAAIEVTDRGPGIRPKIAAQIFEPFFTTSELGSGLGLYLARQLCEANQATLEYLPGADGGACFRITLLSGATLWR